MKLTKVTKKILKILKIILLGILLYYGSIIILGILLFWDFDSITIKVNTDFGYSDINNEEYYIKGTTPFHEGDYEYYLYIKKPLSLKQIGRSGWLYYGLGFKPDSEETLVRIESKDKTIFCYQPATNTLYQPKDCLGGYLN